MEHQSVAISVKFILDIVSVREAIETRGNEQRLIDALRSLLPNNHRDYSKIGHLHLILLGQERRYMERPR